MAKVTFVESPASAEEKKSETTDSNNVLDFTQQPNLPSIYPLQESHLFKKKLDQTEEDINYGEQQHCKSPPPSPPSSPATLISMSKRAESLLTPVFKEYNVHMGGSSVGRGFQRAARYYLEKLAPNGTGSTAGAVKDKMMNGGALEEDIPPLPVEEPFYVCDLGIVVAQYYQWKRLLPRIQPYYAVKCNPDRAVVKTLLMLGADFDCASRQEIRLVQEVGESCSLSPNIIYANPCKARAHLIEAVHRGVRLVTFDNVAEVEKCASISKSIQLIIRIVTDDAGSQCRLSSKFGAPRGRWRPLLSAAKRCGLEVVGVSFHVGSGCRDYSKYELALKDARRVFDMAESEFGFKMSILDIGGGFPGETHSLWNPVDRDPIPSEAAEDTEDVEQEGVSSDEEDEEHNYMFFKDIAQAVGPLVDKLFPPSEGVRVIAEPGRYFVAASCTLVCSVTSIRENALDETSFEPEPISDALAAHSLDRLTRDEEKEIVQGQGNPENRVVDTIVEELASYSKLYAIQNLVQQEVDVYTDKSDMALLDAPPPNNPCTGPQQHHTAEGLSLGLVAESLLDTERPRSMSMGEDSMASLNKDGELDFSTLTIAAAGEAAVSGVVLQAVADSAPLRDDYAYYLNDGVYGAFNNLMFDHASVRPRVLRSANNMLSSGNGEEEKITSGSRDLYASTVFGPTCDSIDVISRSVLLPKLSIGDWVYFQNMGAYTCAAASDFNGFTPTGKFYVCSVLPEEYERKVMKR